MVAQTLPEVPGSLHSWQFPANDWCCSNIVVSGCPPKWPPACAGQGRPPRRGQGGSGAAHPPRAWTLQPRVVAQMQGRLFPTCEPAEAQFLLL